MEYLFFNSFQKQSGIKHLITKRVAGEEAEFSMALHTGEDRSQILSNRQIVQNYMGESSRFVSALQVHGDEVHVVVKRENRGWSELDRSLQVDAMVTNLPNVALTILTADCAPVLFYDPANHAIGAVHAGWQGVHKKIAAKTIEKMNEIYGSRPSDIIAGIGPSIGGCCYEVGGEVAEHFVTYDGALNRKNNGKFMLDLKLVNTIQLVEAGLKKENIEVSPVCTACSHEEFFSYRKEQGCSGRFISMIKIT